MKRRPVPRLSRTVSRFCDWKVKSWMSAPATRMDSEGTNGPIAVSLLLRVATTRLCSRRSNSILRFLPSTLDADGADRKAGITARRNRIVGLAFMVTQVILDSCGSQHDL